MVGKPQKPNQRICRQKAGYQYGNVNPSASANATTIANNMSETIVVSIVIASSVSLRPFEWNNNSKKKKRMNEIYIDWYFIVFVPFFRKQKWEGRREPAKSWQDSDTEIYTRMNRKYPFCSAIAVLESKKIPPVKCFTFDYFLFLLLPPAHSYFFPMIYYCFYTYANKYDMKGKQGEEGCKRHIVGRTIDGKFRFSIANKMKIFTFIKLGCPCKPGVPSSF